MTCLAVPALLANRAPDPKSGALSYLFGLSHHPSAGMAQDWREIAVDLLTKVIQGPRSLGGHISR
jgi:hypothetical protein